MRYAALGKTGLLVSRLSFGAMTFSQAGGDGSRIWKTPSESAKSLIGQALDAGINFFDTADTYAGGESESILGAALAERRHEVVIATKCGFRVGPGLIQSGLNKRHIEWAVARSLQRLQTDFIDVLIAHRDDSLTPLEETLSALNDIVRAGKARYLGFSNWPAWKVAAALEIQRANNWASFTHGQIYYSLIGRDVEHDMFAVAERYGLGLTVWSPLAGGLLTGRYEVPGDDGRLATYSSIPYERDTAANALTCLKTVAKRLGATPAQIALAWLLTKGQITSIILGASSADQLQSNLGAVDHVLSREDLQALDAVAPPALLYPEWHNRAFLDTMQESALAE
jgi:aryl-alcohol dehydrogenase-like predicted oxidoreductase